MRLALFLLAGALAAQQPHPYPPEDKAADLASFDQVWDRVNTRHWEKNPGGLDWAQVKLELRPKVEQARSREESRNVMREMLTRLKQTHFAIIPSDSYETLDAESEGGEGVAGLTVRVLDGEAVVTDVDPDGPAAKAGVRTGWVITKIGNHDVKPGLAKLKKAITDERHWVLYSSAMLERWLSGDIGTVVRVEAVNGNGKTVPVSIARVKPAGMFSKLGFFPGMYIRFEARKVQPGIEYMRLNAFFDPARVMSEFEKTVKGCLDCKGMILDLRGNPGGIGGMAMGMAGWFVDQPNLFLGTMIMRESQLKFVVNPRVETFAGPLPILVDGASASTSEILAGGLQDLGRAKVFGTRTAAAALPSMIERLPNGDGFQYAFANYVSKSGKILETGGVTPDVEVRLTKATLLAGRDPVVDAAVAWIEQSRKEQTK
jgi:carboxyl-terminal processing protease